MAKRYLIALLIQYGLAILPSCPTTPNYVVTAPVPGTNPKLMGVSGGFNGPVTKLSFC